jgi:acyl-CoA synthetase (AMP-forming)/AMP-acid ligase II
VNVIEIFQESARRHASNAAIVSGRAGRESTTTFAELDRRSRQIAALLLEEGLHPGDGVVVLVPMSAELYAIMAALLRLGMVPIFVEPTAWRETLDRAMSALSVRGVIGIPVACAARLLVPALRRIPKAFVAGTYFPGAVSLRSARTLAPCEHLEAAAADRPAILTFTSGSTGRPKGVPRSHGLLAETHGILSAHLGLVPGDLDVAVLPFVVFTNLGAGVGSLIPDADLTRPGAIDAPRLASQIQAWSPAGIVASPALLERLADEALARSVRFDSVQRVFAGGAPVFPRVLDKLAKVAPAARVHAIYGATEAEPMAVLERSEFGIDERDAMHRAKGLLVGRPIPEVQLRIVRDRFGEPRGPWMPSDLDAASAGVEEAGEIVVSGRHVVESYLDAEDDRQLKIRVGTQIWHRTGDAGLLDASGRLWLLGSCKARIEDGRGCRYPLVVDAALSDHGALSRATLVRHQDRVLLVVQPRGDQAEDDLISIGRSMTSAGADELVVIRRLPLDRRHNAKIDHPRLRRMLDERQWALRVPITKTEAPTRAG